MVRTDKDLPSAKRSTYLKALSAFEMGNHAVVVSLMQPLVAEHPEFLTGRKLMREAQIVRSKGRKSLLSTSSLTLMKASPLLKKRDWKAAAEIAEKILEHEPVSAQANKILHEAMEIAANETFEAAQQALDQARRTGADDAALAAAKAQLDQATQRREAFRDVARFALETVILGDPAAPKPRHELGDYLMRTSQFDEAAKLFAELAKRNRGDLEAVSKAKEAAARSSMQTGKLGQTSFETLVKEKQQAMQEAGVGAAAEETLESLAQRVYEAHEAGTPDRDAARKAADLAAAAGDLDRALEYYRYVSALLNDTDPGLLRRISDIELRKISTAIEAAQEELAALPEGDPAREARQQALDELIRHRAELSLTEARRRVERNPTDLQYRFELGEQLVLAGHYKEAIPELQKARSNPNTGIRALYLLGKCYSERGMLDLAAKTLNDAAGMLVAMDATKKDILYTLGLLYERMDSVEKSLECMKQIYEVDYAYRDVADRVEKSYGA